MDHDGAKAAGGIAGRFAIGSPSGSPAGLPPAMSPPLPGTPDDGAAAPADPKQELAFRLRRLQNWFFLGLMYAFFYMSRYNFSAVQAAVAEQFGWSYSDYGSIISAGLLTYGCAVFFNGPLADRVGGKRAILIGAAGAAVFNVLFGLGHLVLLRPATMVGGQVVIPGAAREWHVGVDGHRHVRGDLGVQLLLPVVRRPVDRQDQRRLVPHQ